MKVIIAGSRTKTYNEVFTTMNVFNSTHNDLITEVVCGCAKGVDTAGEKWAHINNIPVHHFPAKWKDLDVPHAIIKQNTYGKYNKNAGSTRNTVMAEYADALILIWDGKSPGSRHMLRTAKQHQLKIWNFIL